jgi:hypothetical protein
MSFAIIIKNMKRILPKKGHRKSATAKQYQKVNENNHHLINK